MIITSILNLAKFFVLSTAATQDTHPISKHQDASPPRSTTFMPDTPTSLQAQSAPLFYLGDHELTPHTDRLFKSLHIPDTAMVFGNYKDNEIEDTLIIKVMDTAKTLSWLEDTRYTGMLELIYPDSSILPLFRVFVNDGQVTYGTQYYHSGEQYYLGTFDATTGALLPHDSKGAFFNINGHIEYLGKVQLGEANGLGVFYTYSGENQLEKHTIGTFKPSETNARQLDLYDPYIKYSPDGFLIDSRISYSLYNWYSGSFNPDLIQDFKNMLETMVMMEYDPNGEIALFQHLYPVAKSRLSLKKKEVGLNAHSVSKKAVSLKEAILRDTDLNDFIIDRDGSFLYGDMAFSKSSERGVRVPYALSSTSPHTLNYTYEIGEFTEKILHGLGQRRVLDKGSFWTYSGRFNNGIFVFGIGTRDKPTTSAIGHFGGTIKLPVLEGFGIVNTSESEEYGTYRNSQLHGLGHLTKHPKSKNLSDFSYIGHFDNGPISGTGYLIGANNVSIYGTFEPSQTGFNFVGTKRYRNAFMIGKFVNSNLENGLYRDPFMMSKGNFSRIASSNSIVLNGTASSFSIQGLPTATVSGHYSNGDANGIGTYALLNIRPWYPHVSVTTRAFTGTLRQGLPYGLGITYKMTDHTLLDQGVFNGLDTIVSRQTSDDQNMRLRKLVEEANVSPAVPLFYTVKLTLYKCAEYFAASPSAALMLMSALLTTFALFNLRTAFHIAQQKTKETELNDKHFNEILPKIRQKVISYVKEKQALHSIVESACSKLYINAPSGELLFTPLLEFTPLSQSVEELQRTIIQALTQDPPTFPSLPADQEDEANRQYYALAADKISRLPLQPSVAIHISGTASKLYQEVDSLYTIPLDNTSSSKAPLPKKSLLYEVGIMTPPSEAQSTPSSTPTHTIHELSIDHIHELLTQARELNGLRLSSRSDVDKKLTSKIKDLSTWVSTHSIHTYRESIGALIHTGFSMTLDTDKNELEDLFSSISYETLPNKFKKLYAEANDRLTNTSKLYLKSIHAASEAIDRFREFCFTFIISRDPFNATLGDHNTQTSHPSEVDLTLLSFQETLSYCISALPSDEVYSIHTELKRLHEGALNTLSDLSIEKTSLRDAIEIIINTEHKKTKHYHAISSDDQNTILTIETTTSVNTAKTYYLNPSLTRRTLQDFHTFSIKSRKNIDSADDALIDALSRECLGPAWQLIFRQPLNPTHDTRLFCPEYSSYSSQTLMITETHNRDLALSKRCTTLAEKISKALRILIQDFNNFYLSHASFTENLTTHYTPTPIPVDDAFLDFIATKYIIPNGLHDTSSGGSHSRFVFPTLIPDMRHQHVVHSVDCRQAHFRLMVLYYRFLGPDNRGRHLFYKQT